MVGFGENMPAGMRCMQLMCVYYDRRRKPMHRYSLEKQPMSSTEMLVFSFSVNVIAE